MHLKLILTLMLLKVKTFPIRRYKLNNVKFENSTNWIFQAQSLRALKLENTQNLYVFQIKLIKNCIISRDMSSDLFANKHWKNVQ